MIQLPKRDEVWQHYKGSKYLVLGIGYDEDGLPVVVYTENTEPPGPMLYTRSLGTFLQTVDVDLECKMTGRAVNAGHIPNGVATKVARFRRTGERRITRGPVGWATHDAGIPTDAPANGGQR